MTRYSILIFVALIALSCDKKIKNESPDSKRIKTILESFHEPISKTGEFDYVAKIAEDTYMFSSLFNEEGVLIQKSRFNSNGNLETKTVYKYDDKGNNIEFVVYNSKGSLLAKTVNKFDSFGKLIEANETSDGKIISKQTSIVDGEGNRKLIFYEYRFGGFVILSERLFDKNGNNVETLSYSGGILKNQERKSYDAKGNLIEFIQNTPSTGEEIIMRYEYDKSNRKIGEVLLKNLLVTSKNMLKYNAKGDLTDVFVYGMLGNVVKHEKHVYEYDREGNWTKQTILINNKPTTVILHQIEYY
jgi:hypothetical protein